MTDTATTPAPKKSNKKTLFVVIALVLSFFGYKQYTAHLIWGADVTVTDTSISVTATPEIAADSIKVVVPVDTTKKDTIIKK